MTPAALTPGEPRDAAWRAIEPHFEQRLSVLLDAYGEARGHGRGADRLEEIAAAMAQSRVGTLLLEADRRIAGSIDTEQGAITHALGAQNPAHDSNPATSDVLDDLAEAALRTGAGVVVLEASRMPSKTDAAAIFRY